jgi:hypothetical protein
MSILSRRAPRVHTLPTSELDDDPYIPSNPIGTAYLWGRQAGLRSEIDRAPGGLNEEEQIAFLDGIRDGRLARHPHDIELDVEFPFEGFDSADAWPVTPGIDDYRWELGA